MTMNAREVRIIDPVITRIARGYVSNLSPIANILFPIVTVTQRGGTIISFGPQDYRRISTRRAFGANTKRIEVGFESGKFSLNDYRLEGSTPVEIRDEARVIPGIDLLTDAVTVVRDAMAREREAEAATLALNPANYGVRNKITLAPTDQWDNDDSDPLTDVEEGKEAIRQAIGVRPNVMVVGPRVATKLRRHPGLWDKVSTTKDRLPMTLEQLARQFEIDRIVEGTTTYYDTELGEFVDIWGDSAILAYTKTGTVAQRGSPNFGYTYQLSGYPRAERIYLGNNENTWYGPVADSYQVNLVGPSAGYLINQAVAPKS